MFGRTMALISDYSVEDVLDAMMAVTCALTYMRINQIDAYNFLILLPEKEDVKKKTDKDTAMDVKKKGIVLCFLRLCS